MHVWEKRMAERWKSISGYEGIYLVSDHGRIRSVDRWVYRGNDSYLLRGKIMTPRPTSGGYLTVALNGTGRQKTHYVHRLVAQAFCKKADQSYNVVLHKDDVPSNCHYKNLTWGTQAHNNTDRAIKGRARGPAGSKHACAKITEAQVIKMRRQYATGKYSIGELATVYGIEGSNAGRILSRKTWRHV